MATGKGDPETRSRFGGTRLGGLENQRSLRLIPTARFRYVNLSLHTHRIATILHGSDFFILVNWIVAVPLRNVLIILGDQLNTSSPIFHGFDRNQDAVWMAEVSNESTHVWSHKARIVLFLSAMRHFRDELSRKGITVYYTDLRDSTLDQELRQAVRTLKPQRVMVVEPGEWRVQEELKQAVPELQIIHDTHFLCSREEFSAYASGRKQLRLEFFYRELRRKHHILIENNRPVGGAWNFDAENRQSFDKNGPGHLPSPVSFKPDATTREVISLVEKKFAQHPGRLQKFDWPLTRSQALQALDDFIANRLPEFGRYQDAMWSGHPWLFHSRLSAALNVKLLNPLEVIKAAEDAYYQKQAPLASVEGFIRQILGWREYVRGIYWYFMPSYAEKNELQADVPLPPFYWSGETDMNCLREVITQTLEYGYAHHIQRLMVTGLYALLLGVKPVEIHQWYLAIYVDAVEWVELPNVLGMSQYADGGWMASKPYIASGKYIQRMSNYCQNCRFHPDQSTGGLACPFTTLYWDFLMQHQKRLEKNQRMQMQLRNLQRLDKSKRTAIRKQADTLRSKVI